MAVQNRAAARIWLSDSSMGHPPARMLNVGGQPRSGRSKGHQPHTRTHPPTHPPEHWLTQVKSLEHLKPEAQGMPADAWMLQHSVRVLMQVVPHFE